MRHKARKRFRHCTRGCLTSRAMLRAAKGRDVAVMGRQGAGNAAVTAQARVSRRCRRGCLASREMVRAALGRAVAVVERQGKEVG